MQKDLHFTENPAIASSRERFIDIDVDAKAVLESWKKSVFSFEWLAQGGRIKFAAELSPPEKAKRDAVEQALNSGKPLIKPVLGIGIMDNIEIGSGRAEFLTLAALGVKMIPVHIPKSNETDFKPFRARIES